MSTPRNPENKRHYTSVRLSPELLDKLDAAAKERMLGRNKLIELLLIDALARLLPPALTPSRDGAPE